MDETILDGTGVKVGTRVRVGRRVGVCVMKVVGVADAVSVTVGEATAGCMAVRVAATAVAMMSGVSVGGRSTFIVAAT
ncbi:MAG: hypothetical protein K8I82_28450 [Anaerolineae bacterium]|nr:hypothetical protein [Anaerolineae bacterium]